MTDREREVESRLLLSGEVELAKSYAFNVERRDSGPARDWLRLHRWCARVEVTILGEEVPPK